MSDDSQLKQDDHNAGQAEGARGNAFADAIQDLTPFGWIERAFLSDEFLEGRENGRNNRPK